MDAGYADCLNALSREIPFKAYQSLAATTEFTPRIRPHGSFIDTGTDRLTSIPPKKLAIFDCNSLPEKDLPNDLWFTEE